MNAILKTVKSAGDAVKTYALTLLIGDDERKYTVDEGTYLRIGCPLPVVSLEDEALGLITECDERIRCVRRAARMLGYSDKSERALAARLREAGFSQSAVRYAIGRCCEAGYLNEDRALENLIERYANRELLGPYRISARLLSRGYRGADISRALASLADAGTVDFKQNARALLKKKGVSADAEVQKILYKYGYRK
ncbi:MAG: RecX family transcriptional regulator [Clostridia bacterium]|nr:RecX family transcriptional regulator [Clostridia bacterium]